MNAPYDIELHNVSFQYDQNIVLKNISLQVKQGDFLAVLGPNGSGKSTLLKIILGLLKPTSGTVDLFGVKSRDFKKREWLGYVSQKSNAFNTGFPATVYEVVQSGLVKKTGLFKNFPKDSFKRVEKALNSVGMIDFMNQSIGELSGGQQQRVFIARALVAEPKCLILDEPTVGIDHQHVQSFYNMLAELNREQNLTLILVTHDVDTVSSKISHVACLNQTIHFHGFKNEFNQLSDEDRQAWYGHSVRKIHHAKSGGTQ
ncbi:MAG: ABC transporter ATP-binding protein [Paenisporosarcina sp.]|nr:ABC transporter ATP-binding protein [Paenisporosarcina sp.]